MRSAKLQEALKVSYPLLSLLEDTVLSIVHSHDPIAAFPSSVSPLSRLWTPAENTGGEYCGASCYLLVEICWFFLTVIRDSLYLTIAYNASFYELTSLPRSFCSVTLDYLIVYY